MSKLAVKRLAVLAFISVVIPNFAVAEKAIVEMADETIQDKLSSKTKYDESFYGKFKPVTLNDILRRIPGTNIILASLNSGRSNSDRGFGSDGEQLLINGKRMSGKSNNISNQLETILAKDVERVELIRGSASGLGVRSDGLIINVIMNRAQGTSSTVWTAKGSYLDGREVKPAGVITHSGSRENLSYSASAEKITWRTSETVTMDRNRENGLDYQDIDRYKENYNSMWKFTSNARYEFENGDTFRLNGLYEKGKFTDVQTEDLINSEDPSESNILTRGEINDKYKWEIGGDYEKSFDRLGLLKVLFVINKRQDNKDRTFPRVFADASKNTFTTNLNDRIQEEKILRASLNSTITEKHSLEVGTEFAINDQLDLFDFSLSTPTETEIKETRLEGFSTYSYTFSDDILVQAGLIAEYSKISVEGSRTDTYFFLKPRFDLRYDITDSDQLRAVIDRKVKQLNFSDFFASIDFTEVATQQGNTNIEQEKHWEYSLAYEKQLPNNSGSITLKGYYRDISDHIARAPVVTPVCPVAVTDCTDALATSFIYSDRPSNIGGASVLGLEIDASLRLDNFGIPDAVLSISYEKLDTNVTEPFTGTNTRIRWKDDYAWEIDYQQDITSYGISYGISFEKEGPTSNIDNDELWFIEHDETIEFFIEKRIFNNLKLKFEASRLFEDDSYSRRNKYLESISLNNIDYIEDRNTNKFSRYIFSVQGTF